MAKAVIKGSVGLDTQGVDVRLASLQQRSMGFAQRFGGVGGRMGASFASAFNRLGPAGVIAGLGVALGVVGGLVAKAGLAALSRVETITTQFKVLFGDIKQAKAHLMDLRDFSAKTPFQLSGISKASRLLYQFSEGAMGGRDSLRLVGDAAAATGNDLEGVAMWVGRAYGAIKAGKPFGEASARLQELGILTASTRARMEEMQKAGASGAEIWKVLTGELKKYEGGMEELSGTIAGKGSTIKDSWENMLAGLGEFFAPVWKSIQDMIIGVLESITAAIQKTHQFFRTIKLWKDADMSWAEARAQAERELQELMAQRKQDKLEMTGQAESEADKKRLEAEKKALEKDQKALEKEKAGVLKDKLSADTRLGKIGAGGMMQERLGKLQGQMAGNGAFAQNRNGETRLLKDQYTVQQNTLKTLMRQEGALERISRNTADWSVT